jgi:hypothetical protein
MHTIPEGFSETGLIERLLWLAAMGQPGCYVMLPESDRKKARNYDEFCRRLKGEAMFRLEQDWTRSPVIDDMIKLLDMIGGPELKEYAEDMLK